MIKTTVIESKRMVVCELKDTRYDAIRQIEKYLRGNLNINWDRYIIPNHFRSAVVCHKDDVFSAEEGYKKAKERLLNKYYKAKNAAVNRFITDLNDTMFEVVANCN